MSMKISISGTVVKGKQIGRTIGIPTANIAVENDSEIPAIGVYAAFVELDNQMYNAVVSVSDKPKNCTKVEAHILDFSGDIYGKNMCVYFEKFLHGKQVYMSLGELRHSIQNDIEQARILKQIEN